jgi:hypothetical protein
MKTMQTSLSSNERSSDKCGFELDLKSFCEKTEIKNMNEKKGNIHDKRPTSMSRHARDLQQIREAMRKYRTGPAFVNDDDLEAFRDSLKIIQEFVEENVLTQSEAVSLEKWLSKNMMSTMFRNLISNVFKTSLQRYSDPAKGVA